MKNLWMSALALLTVTAMTDAVFASDACLSCHENEPPGIVTFWRGSVHFQKHVGCTDCHGNDEKGLQYPVPLYVEPML